MSRDEIVEFTPEGFKKVAAALTFLPEDKRETMLAMLCGQFIR